MILLIDSKWFGVVELFGNVLFRNLRFKNKNDAISRGALNDMKF